MKSAADLRLAKLEHALSPREAVVAWLVEAQQFPSLVDHARSIVRLPVEAAPFSVIGELIEASVRGSMKGQPRDAVGEAVRREVGDGAFLFTLVIAEQPGPRGRQSRGSARRRRLLLDGIAAWWTSGRRPAVRGVQGVRPRARRGVGAVADRR